MVSVWWTWPGCSSCRRSRLSLQTPQVQNVLQTAEEPEQRGEEQGGAGRSPRQRLPGAAAAHAASGGRPVTVVMDTSRTEFRPLSPAPVNVNVLFSLRMNTKPSISLYRINIVV